MGNLTDSHEGLPHPKLLITFVGMPGSGKSEATRYLKEKGFPFARFGDITDEEVLAKGLQLTEENERVVREELRRNLGMGAYAIKMQPKIDALLEHQDAIALDGLYSWEEYVILKKRYPGLTLVHIYAEPKIRYERLEHREVRPRSREESFQRDIAELEQLDKGGPIAIADYLIENNTNEKDDLREKLQNLLERLGVTHD